MYLVHIAECIRKIEANTAVGRDAFFASDTLQDAVLRNLQVMSESTQMLSTAYKQAHPALDWRRIGDFRNRLVHDYLGVDMEIVWKVIAEDLPELKRIVFESL